MVRSFLGGGVCSAGLGDAGVSVVAGGGSVSCSVAIIEFFNVEARKVSKKGCVRQVEQFQGSYLVGRKHSVVYFACRERDRSIGSDVCCGRYQLGEMKRST